MPVIYSRSSLSGRTANKADTTPPCESPLFCSGCLSRRRVGFHTVTRVGSLRNAIKG
jgi:hypothetical protein